MGHNRDGGGVGSVEGRYIYRDCVCEIESKKIDSQITDSERMD